MASDVDRTEPKLAALPVAAVVPSRSPVLPVEVCERIIDFCAQDAWLYAGLQSLLHACALVCRDWLPRSRLHLYYHVPLRTERAFVQFLHAVQTNSLLGTFVREVSLRGRDDDNSLQGLEEKEGIQTAAVGSSPPPPKQLATWIVQVPLRLLPLLPVLRRIQMRHLPMSNGTTHMFFSKFRSCRTVTVLNLVDCDFPSSQDLLRFLSYFSSLKTITFQNIAIVNTNSNVANRYLRMQPRLELFRMSNSSDGTLMDGLATWPILSHVTGLIYLCNREVMARGLEQVLPRCSSTIVGLDILLFEEGGAFYHAPDAAPQIALPEHIKLSSASNLRYLRICIRLVKGAEDLLGTLSLPTNIECITLVFLLLADSLVLVRSQPWDTFDASLSGPEFTGLKEVRLMMHERGLSETDKSELRLAMNSNLPKLRRRGVLLITYRTHDNPDSSAVWR